MKTEKGTEEFLKIFDEHTGLILKIAMAYTHIAFDREDLVSEIVLEMWKSYAGFRAESKISTWVYRVALNTAINYVRKKKKDDILLAWDHVKTLEGPLLVEQDNDSNELEILHSCIEELNDINKAIILLYLDGNSYEEIAEITGISKSNVGTRIGRIKEQLKKLAQEKSE